MCIFTSPNSYSHYLSYSLNTYHESQMGFLDMHQFFSPPLLLMFQSHLMSIQC